MDCTSFCLQLLKGLTNSEPPMTHICSSHSSSLTLSSILVHVLQKPVATSYLLLLPLPPLPPPPPPRWRSLPYNYSKHILPWLGVVFNFREGLDLFWMKFVEPKSPRKIQTRLFPKEPRKYIVSNKNFLYCGWHRRKKERKTKLLWSIEFYLYLI